jgi:hypothetical protein
VLSFVIAILQLAGFEKQYFPTHWKIVITIQRRRMPVLILVMSALVMTTLLIYFASENFN